MGTQTSTVRVPPDLKAESLARAAEMRLNFSEYVCAALAEKNGRPAPEALRQALERAAAAEAALERVAAEMAGLRARVAGAAGVRVPRRAVPAGADRDGRLAAELEAATPAAPARKRHLEDVTGFGHTSLEKRLRFLRDHGCLTQPDAGLYARVPGADIREGLRAWRKQAAAEIRESRRAAREAAAGGTGAQVPSPPPAPARPAAASTAPPGVKSAAREKNGSTPGAAPRPPVAASPDRAAEVAEAAREAGHDVRTASELAAVPVGAAMFQAPGEEKVIRGLAPEVPDHSGKKGRPAPATVAAACPPHPRKRVIKGFCYACGRQVPDDERIK